MFLRKVLKVNIKLDQNFCIKRKKGSEDGIPRILKNNVDKNKLKIYKKKISLKKNKFYMMLILKFLNSIKDGEYSNEVFEINIPEKANKAVLDKRNIVTEENVLDYLFELKEAILGQRRN